MVVDLIGVYARSVHNGIRGNARTRFGDELETRAPSFAEAANGANALTEEERDAVCRSVFRSRKRHFVRIADRTGRRKKRTYRGAGNTRLAFLQFRLRKLAYALDTVAFGSPHEIA